MGFSKDELQKMRLELPKGANQKLADKFHLKYGSVNKILNGHFKNDEVVLAAAEMARLHQEKLAGARNSLVAS